MRFDDERAKETNDGRRILLFPFCLPFFFLPELHHDRDAKEHLGALTFLQLTILSSQLKEDDQTQQTTVFISSRRNIPCRIIRLLDECIGESEHLNRVFFLTSLHFTFSRVPKCTPAKVSLSTSLLALDEVVLDPARFE
jgi:hypothetical protein